MFLSKLSLRSLASTAILFAVAGQLSAQELNENNFTHYTKQDGLSHNMITGIVQDSTGYIWMSTLSGLNRFNGGSFVQFHSSTDPLSLPTESIRGLLWLDKQRLAAYNDGLHIIDQRTGATRNLFVPYADKKYQYKFNAVRSIKTNAAGELFLLTYSGFYHYDRNYRLVYRYDHYPEAEIANITFAFGRDLFWLDDHRLLIVSIAGIYCYNSKTREFKKMEASDAPPLAEFLDYAEKKDYLFFQHRPGSFFIMKSSGDSVVYLDLAKKIRTVSHLPFHAIGDEFGYRTELVPVSDTIFYLTSHLSGFYKMRFYPGTGEISFSPKKYFPTYSCRHLLLDRDHNLWIATNKGLLRQDNRQVFVQKGYIPESLQAQFPNIVIDDIHISGDKLYVGTRGNGGLLVFNKERLSFLRRIEFNKHALPANNVYSIVSVNDTNLMIGTNGPLFLYNTDNNHLTPVKLDKWDKGHDWIADVCKDRKDNIWIASSHIYKYEAATGKYSIISKGPEPYNKIEESSTLKEDTSGNIWVGGHGLFRYNVAFGLFDRIIDSFPFIKLQDRRVNSFVVDHQNNLWINNYNNGLVCYNTVNGITRHFTREEGLPDNSISSMIVIGNKLWLATFSGIACLDVQTFRITSFGTEDGFPDLPILNGAKFHYDIALNKLYIGFTSTIVQFDPDIIFQKSQAPHFFIESLIAGDQKEIAYPQKTITTTWQNNEITVTIGSINFTTSNSQRFAYRILKDDSTHWQQLGVRNTFNISSLSPGNYRIQVKLFSLDNRWPEQVKEIDIMVLPPFWKQTWFTVLMVILLLLAVYLLLKWRTELTRKKEQAKTHLQKLKADEYKNQFELEQISHYFSSSLADKKNVGDVLWDVMKNLIGRMKYTDCIIYMWNEDKTKMVQKSAYGPKGDPKTINDKTFDVLPGQGIVGHVMETREAVLVPDTRSDRRYRVDDIMRLSEICVPIIHNDELIGIIDSEHPSEDYFKGRDLKILTTIATLVGNKIKQIESQQSLEIKKKEIAFINQQLAEAQLSALQTQMNPHFIFNSLNSIKGMILENEQQKASRYLSKFALMIRTTLNQSKEIFTTLYENIEHLENYLLMEKLRFDDSFLFRIVVDKDIDKEEILIPTMMIQPLAENAIWHGLMRKDGEKKLSIRFSRMEETIFCSITDNGIGINRSEQLKKLNKPPHHSVGLSNLRNRIKIMNEKYDTDCTLEISDLKDYNKGKTGTRVILRFNVITTKPCI